jgi:hypothetical protein
MTSAPALRAAAAIAAILSILWIAGCDREPGLAGGWTDTDTGTKVTGVLIREDGRPAANALVLLRPADYLAKNPTGADSLGTAASGGSILDVQCDSAGRFAFDSVNAGAYSLEARDREINGALIRFIAPPRKARLTLAPATVRGLGSIFGRASFADSVPGALLVRIFGLERSALVEPATGRFTFPHVPAGEFTLHVSGLEPFVTALEKPAVPVATDSLTDAGDLLVRRGLKQDFAVTGGLLDLPGVGPGNPVVYENGAFINPVDGAYLWAKASMGNLDLRGVLVSYGRDTGAAALEVNRNNCLALMRIAHLSGMRGIPDPIMGSSGKLLLPASGNLGDIRPQESEGARLLIAEARKATPAKPLTVISGANLTTVACALLLEPAIADRMIVIGTNNGNFNREDSLALRLVAKKARMIEWARDFTWADAKLPTNTDAPRLGHRYAELMRAHREKDRTPGLWALSFFADFGASTYLYDRKVWKSAAAADWIAPPLVSATHERANAGGPFDFVDVPLAATDWGAIQAEFYATINDPAAIHPWPLAEGLMAEAYSAQSGTTVSPGLDGSGEALIWSGPGSWAEYDVSVDSGATYAMEFRYRSAGGAILQMKSSGSPSAAVLTLPIGNVWDTLSVDIPVSAGRSAIRLECTQGSAILDWIHPKIR